MFAKTTDYWTIQHDAVPWKGIPCVLAQHQKLPVELGRCESSLFNIETGLSMIETHYQPNRKLAVISQMSLQEPRMILTLALTGQSCFQSQNGQLIGFKSGFSTITVFNASAGKRLYAEDQSTTQLRFSMSLNWLEQQFGPGIFSRFFKQRELSLVAEQPLSDFCSMACQYLLNQQVTQNTLPLFRQGLVLSLIADALSHLLTDELPPASCLQSAEKRLLNQARDILHAEYQNPPSIAELSKRIGTNPCKLKQLFRQHFETTPYGMLLDIRMQQAAQLLKNRQTPINKIAESVGYQHPSNFSTAFSRYFGYSPKSLKHKKS